MSWIIIFRWEKEVYFIRSWYITQDIKKLDIFNLYLRILRNN